MRRTRTSRALALLATTVVGVTAALAPSPSGAAPEGGEDGPEVHSPAYVARDLQNIADAYGRITGPGGQLQDPAYLPALVAASSATTVAQLLAQVATPTRLALTAGNVVPGWNVGNPLRAGWDGTRGRMREVSFTNRYGALLRGTVYRPLPGAVDPYTGARVRGPFPGVVITPGSVQGSEGMYRWLAQDLAERGYVVLTYDVQGQGRSETLPHEGDQLSALPFCNPFAPPRDREVLGCPGVPFQQVSNFVVGTEDAIDFFVSTPAKPYANPAGAGATPDRFNPFWRSFDRSRDPRPATPGRTTRLAIIGHSMGARAVSEVQGTDDRVATVVALDKLFAGEDGGTIPSVPTNTTTPSVPALAVQSEYGFTVAPYLLSAGSSLVPAPTPDGPDPRRERRAGYDRWAASRHDAMLVVPRASTHLDYTDIPLVLPASRHGQALTSVYVQRWLDRYLKHRGGPEALLRTSYRYLEPAAGGARRAVRLQRDDLLSFYYCSAYDLGRGEDRRTDGDVTDVGC
ncbi:alpha/beta hydrolase [Nocardioides sp. SOB77]|uniref:Alpha/beta hydrolase n=1 Tax=Nocardioides oceani TaxID=3058369 RepID=A0ABT8FBI6_9ACTN|nr:alpha/beta hydrolase [Nocardioides oceani]MDN4172054.1 alpha/beta hydrolase [Nocardioides oceani]